MVSHGAGPLWFGEPTLHFKDFGAPLRYISLERSRPNRVPHSGRLPKLGPVAWSFLVSARECAKRLGCAQFRSRVRQLESSDQLAGLV